MMTPAEDEKRGNQAADPDREIRVGVRIVSADSLPASTTFPSHDTIDGRRPPRRAKKRYRTTAAVR
jgi:hypothetical protein